MAVKVKLGTAGQLWRWHSAVGWEVGQAAALAPLDPGPCASPWRTCLGRELLVFQEAGIAPLAHVLVPGHIGRGSERPEKWTQGENGQKPMCLGHGMWEHQGIWMTEPSKSSWPRQLQSWWVTETAAFGVRVHSLGCSCCREIAMGKTRGGQSWSPAGGTEEWLFKKLLHNLSMLWMADNVFTLIILVLIKIGSQIWG